MKLNADYVREILLFVEKELVYDDNNSPFPHTHKQISNIQLISDPYFISYNKSELSYALEQLIKEGYIELAGVPNKFNNNINMAKIIGLTWRGHELLDNIRDNTIWGAVKKKAAHFGGLSISSLFSAAKFLGCELMSNPNAIQNFLQGIDNISKLI